MKKLITLILITLFLIFLAISSFVVAYQNDRKFFLFLNSYESDRLFYNGGIGEIYSGMASIIKADYKKVYYYYRTVQEVKEADDRISYFIIFAWCTMLFMVLSDIKSSKLKRVQDIVLYCNIQDKVWYLNMVVVLFYFLTSATWIASLAFGHSCLILILIGLFLLGFGFAFLIEEGWRGSAFLGKEEESFLGPQVYFTMILFIIFVYTYHQF